VFNRLLLPLDGSRLAEAALPAAAGIAAAFGSTIVLLHVIERGAPATVHGERHFTDNAAADAYLRGLAGALQVRGLTARVHVHDAPEGNVAVSIAQHSDEEQTDLIVLCTHGGGGVRGLLFGSIAQQVVQRGTTPVLLIRPPAAGSAPPAFAPRTVLVPLDATAASEVAIAPAVELAKAFSARLHLTMVVATRATVRGDQSPLATLLPSATRVMLDLEREQADAYLRQQADRLREAGLEVETEVRRGDTPDQLAGDVAEHQAGLVVVATHGRAGLQAIWTGSVATRLLSRTTAPVLLVRTVEG